MPAAEYDVIAELYDSLIPDPPHMIEFYIQMAEGVSGPILDIGCGTGRQAVALAERGHTVIGCDVSPGMIAVANRIRAERPELADRLTFQVADVRELPFTDPFELIIMPGGVFEYLLRVEDQKKALGEIRRLLKPGGRLVFDIVTPPLYTPRRTKDAGKSAPPQPGKPWTLSWVESQYDHFLQIAVRRSYFELYDEHGRLRDKYCFQFVQRYFTLPELELLLEVCGFRVLDRYGDFDRSPLTRRSEFLIFVATPAATGVS